MASTPQNLSTLNALPQGPSVSSAVALGRNGQSSPRSASAAALPSPLLERLVKRGVDGPYKFVLSKDDADALVQLVIRDFDDSISAINDFKLNMVEMQKNWRRTPEPKDFPFEGAANIVVPMTAPAIEQMKARLLKALWGDGKLISEITQLDRELQSSDLSDANHWFHYELTEVAKLRSVLDGLLHQLLVFGISLPIPTYDHDTRVLHSVRHFPLTDDPIEQQLDGAVSSILSEQSEWCADPVITVTKDHGDGTYELSDDGEISFSVTRDGDRGPDRLSADIWKRETIFDGVRVRLTRLQDLAVIPSAESVDDIPFFGTRYWCSVQKFRERLDDEFYIDNGKSENDRIAGSADIKVGDTMQRHEDDQADREEGTDSSDSTAYYPNRRWLEIYRWEGWFCPNERRELGQQSGRILEPAIQVVAHVAKRAQKLLRVELLEDLNKAAKRSPVKFEFISEPDRFFPMGLAEWLRFSQTEIDVIHNQRLDAGTIMNVPFFFYDPATGFQNDILKVKPGEGYPVKFTNGQPGVLFPRINWQPTASFQEENLSVRYANLQAGLSDPAMGQPTSKRQSASEFVGLSAAMDLRTERIVENLLASLRELLYRILGLYQQFGPRERIFRLAGPDGTVLVKRFERDRLQGRLWLELAGNLQQTNEQLQRQISVDMLQLLLNQIFIQLGIVGPDTIYQAITNVIKAMGGQIDLHKPDVPPTSDSPQLEGRQLFEGFTVKGPSPTENFSEHLTVHMRTDISEWPPEAVQRMQQHIQSTIQLQQQVQIMRQTMAAQAVSAQSEMAAKGIRPGMAGGQRPREGAGRPATAAEVRGGQQGGPPQAAGNPLGGTPTAVG